MILLNTWLYLPGVFCICMLIVIALVAIAPEYIEDENGMFYPKKEYDKLKTN